MTTLTALPSRIIQTVDDRINPIVVKELRQAVQSRFVVIGLGLFLLLQLVIVGLFLLGEEFQRRAGSMDFRAGQQAFATLQLFLLGSCMLFVPLYTGIRLAAERSDANVDLLFISALRPRSIVAGKLVSALVLILLMFSGCAPFMTFSYLLRGIDIPSILLVMFMDLVAVLACSQVAILLASLPGNRASKLFIGLAGFFGLLTILGFCLAISSELVRSGVARLLDSPTPRAGLIGTLAGIGLVGALMFIWSVALISPASSNRALPVRVVTVLVWGGLYVIARICAGVSGQQGAVHLWAWVSIGLLFLSLFIGISERDEWTPRVARTIPKTVVLRLLAFFFYSGSAGGVAFAMLMLAVTLQLGFRPGASGGGFTRGLDFLNDVETAGLLMLYMFCYALSAVFLTRTVLRGRLKNIYTWAIAFLLMGVGGSMPIFAYVLVPDDRGYERRHERFWLAGNPLSAVGDTENIAFYYGATIGWAVVLVLICSPWFFGQLRRFKRPAAPSAPRHVEPVLEVVPATEAS